MKHRARSEDEKEHRRLSILRSARRLFEKKRGGELPAVATIAQSAGVAKGTIYLYYASRESIFLELAAHLLNEWFADAAKMLQRMRSPTPHRVARAVARFPLKHPALFHLHAIKPQLEQSLTAAEIEAGMRETAQRFVDGAALLRNALPGFDDRTSRDAMIRVYAMLAGLWQTHYDLLVRLRHPERPKESVYGRSFEAMVVGSIEAVLVGSME